MLFSWLRARRRRKLLAEPFPVRWLAFFDRNVGHYPRLSPPEQNLLRDRTRVLVAEKRWLGRGGLFVTEEMKVTIAAQASLLLLGIDHGYFPSVREVVVFPSEFRTPVADDDWEDDGLSEMPLAGQAVDRGPVLLAWDEVLSEGRDPDAGYNVVIHEFAHQLDFLDGLAGGTPHLGDHDLETRWHYAMTVSFENHYQAVRKHDPDAYFSPHAAESESEFLAEASEAFFCRPNVLNELLPEVYRLFAAYHRVNPLQWFG
jgi:Mlc titration factor MtfA (ptsG expression regulator)